MNIDVKIIIKALGNSIQKYVKKTIHYDQVRFFPGVQGWGQMTGKSVSVIHNSNKRKNKQSHSI